MRTAIILLQVMTLGILDWSWRGGARSRDMLEDAVDYCADCGTEIPAGDYLCDECCE
jgi:hypothetical protein